MSGGIDFPVPACLDRRNHFQTKPSWRNVLEIHPAADLFPLMSRDELLELGNDIKRNGLKSPVIILDASDDYMAQRLLDGRNRLDAMEMVGLKIVGDNDGGFPLRDGAAKYKIVPATTDPVAYVVSANLHRRHLTAEQKRDLIAKLLKATPEKSNRAIAGTVKADHKTVAVIRSEQERTGEIPQLTKTIGKDGKTRTVKPKPRAASPSESAASKIADKYISKPKPEPSGTDRQYEILKSLWCMSNVLQAAWAKSNAKAKRRFIQWLDGGGAPDDDETRP